MKPSVITLVPTTSPFPLTLTHYLAQYVLLWCLPAILICLLELEVQGHCVYVSSKCQSV